MGITNLTASAEEQCSAMPADSIIPKPMYSETRAITISAPVERIWPWLVQMGSGRAGWYAFDRIDNGGRPSAKSILPQFQHIAPGDILPALPGMKDVFLVTVVDPPHRMVLTVPDPAFGSRVSWEFLLKPLHQNQTRLIVRGRVSPHWLDNVTQARSETLRRPAFIERVYSLLARIPQPIMLAIASLGHGLMEVRQLYGIKRRSET